MTSTNEYDPNLDSDEDIKMIMNRKQIQNNKKKTMKPIKIDNDEEDDIGQVDKVNICFETIMEAKIYDESLDKVNDEYKKQLDNISKQIKQQDDNTQEVKKNS